MKFTRMNCKGTGQTSWLFSLLGSKLSLIKKQTSGTTRSITRRHYLKRAHKSACKYTINIRFQNQVLRRRSIPTLLCSVLYFVTPPRIPSHGSAACSPFLESSTCFFTIPKNWYKVPTVLTCKRLVPISCTEIRYYIMWDVCRKNTPNGALQLSKN